MEPYDISVWMKHLKRFRFLLEFKTRSTNLNGVRNCTTSAGNSLQVRLHTMALLNDSNSHHCVPLQPSLGTSNTRPYLIFLSYIATCFSLAVFITVKLFSRYSVLHKSTTTKPPPRRYILLFTALAVGSLFSTWSFMIKYFNTSYQTWLLRRHCYELDPHQRHWGLWLKETGLFREAWEIVLTGVLRYWWSHQIFFHALGLSLYMEQKGILHTLTSFLRIAA